MGWGRVTRGWLVWGVLAGQAGVRAVCPDWGRLRDAGELGGCGHIGIYRSPASVCAVFGAPIAVIPACAGIWHRTSPATVMEPASIDSGFRRNDGGNWNDGEAGMTGKIEPPNWKRYSRLCGPCQVAPGAVAHTAIPPRLCGACQVAPGGRRIQPFCRGFLWLAGGKCAGHYGRLAPGSGGWRRLRRCAGGRGDVSDPGAGAPFLTHALTAGMLTPKVRAMEVNELPS